MGRTIEIKLNDAQHAALSAEVEASGQKFYDYCRNKLMAGAPMLSSVAAMRILTDQEIEKMVPGTVKRVALTADDRIARVEDTLARLADYVMGQPGVVQQVDVGAEGHSVPMTLIDVDSMVESTLADAEQQGLTQPVYTEADREMAIVGVRAVGPRRAPPYSPGTQPQHLR